MAVELTENEQLAAINADYEQRYGFLRTLFIRASLEAGGVKAVVPRRTPDEAAR